MNNKNVKLKILSAVMSVTMLFGTGTIGITASAASQTNNAAITINATSTRATISNVKTNAYEDVVGITITLNNAITLSSGTTISKITTQSGSSVGYNATCNDVSGNTHAIPLNGQTGNFSYSLVSTSSTESNGQRTTTYKYKGYFKNDYDYGYNGYQSINIWWQETKVESIITDSTVPKMSNGKKVSEKFNGSTKNAVVYSIEENSGITFNIKTNAKNPMYEFAIRNVNDSKYTVVKQFSTNNNYKYTLKAGQYIVRTRIKDKYGNIVKRYYNIDSKLSLKSSTIVSSKDSTLSNIVANEKTTFNVNYQLDKYKILYKKSINSSWKTIKSFDNDKHSITFQTTGSYDIRLVYIRDDGSTATRDYKITPISKDSLRTLSLKFT